LPAQQYKRILARELAAFAAHFSQIAACHQRDVGLGGDDVVARLRQRMIAAIEKHRPRQIGDGFKKRGAVVVIRQFGAQKG
jgi:hypothetical protein